MSPIISTDTSVVGKTKARMINASPEYQARIYAGRGKFFYATTSAVTVSSTEVAEGSSIVVEQPVWIISNTRCTVSIEYRQVESSSGFGEPFGVWSWQPIAVTSGTDVAFAEKKLFLAGIYLPSTKTVTGIGILLGGEGGTNKVVAGLYGRGGKLLAQSSGTTEGTVAGTKETVQSLAFTSPFTAPAGRYFIGITGNGTTAKFRTIPTAVSGANTPAGEVELATKNVLADAVMPSTFTGAKGPVGFIY